jgi:hypothetical protein
VSEKRAKENVLKLCLHFNVLELVGEYWFKLYIIVVVVVVCGYYGFELISNINSKLAFLSCATVAFSDGYS